MTDCKETDFGPGTVSSEPCPGVTLCYISPEARDLLEVVIREWVKHKASLPETMTVDGETWNPRESVYGFAYWLIRWSGLVQARPHRRRKERPKSLG